MKDNAKYEVVETIFENELSDKQAGVMRVKHIHLQYKTDKKNRKIAACEK